jgi:hypothetical protein
MAWSARVMAWQPKVMWRIGQDFDKTLTTAGRQPQSVFVRLRKIAVLVASDLPKLNRNRSQWRMG